MNTQTRQILIFAAFVLLMAITRSHHFASSFNLPDASLAIFMLSGFMLPGFGKKSLSAFIFLLLAAAGIDYYAINLAGIDDYCFTPAYLFLIPTYAVMWLGGSWISRRMKHDLSGLALFGVTAGLCTSLAFAVSNLGFFLLSGRLGEMNMAEYASKVAQYYPPYTGGSLLYLGLAALAFTIYHSIHPAAPCASQQ